MLFMRILGITLLTVICGGCGDDDRQPLIDIDPPPDASAIDEHASWCGTQDLIAFNHDQQLQLGDPDSSGIYTINPDGSAKRLFLRADLVLGVSWSPDGCWIVANVKSELWKISYPEGAVDTLLTNGEYYYPSWSPDGSAICYADRGGPDRGIYTIDQDGLNAQLIIPYGDNPIWAHIDSLAYINFDTTLPSGALCMADLTNGQRRVILDIGDSFVPGTLSPRIYVPGHKIIMQAQTPGQMPGVWKMSLEDSTASLLMNRAAYPNFLADGNEIVFTRIGKPYGNLWIINWDGTGLRELTESVFILDKGYHSIY